MHLFIYDLDLDALAELKLNFGHEWIITSYTK